MKAIIREGIRKCRRRSRTAGPGAGADDGAVPGRLKQENASEIITLRERKDVLRAGPDMDRDAIRVAAPDRDGKILAGRKIPHAPESVRDMAGRPPRQTGCVTEPSSVWEGVCRLTTEGMKLGAAPSNPRTTLLIAWPKTGKVDAVVLADMGRGYCIAARCVIDIKTVGVRGVRRRCGLVRKRAQRKIPTRDVLLQLNFRVKAARFLTPRICRVRDLKSCWMIYTSTQIEVFDSIIKAAGRGMRGAVGNNKHARLMKTMPGLADFSAPAVASLMGDTERFNSPEAPCLHVGVVPSVRSSANKAYCGDRSRRHGKRPHTAQGVPTSPSADPRRRGRTVPR